MGPQPYRNVETAELVSAYKKPGQGWELLSLEDGSGAALGEPRSQPCPGCEVHRNRGGVLAHNIIAGNNFLGCGAAENAALKVHGFSGEVVGNLIIGNFDSAAMWFDDLWWDLRISRNVVVSQSGGAKEADWAGIMLEVITGPALLDNNVIFTTGAQGGIY